MYSLRAFGNMHFKISVIQEKGKYSLFNFNIIKIKKIDIFFFTKGNKFKIYLMTRILV